MSFTVNVQEMAVEPSLCDSYFEIARQLGVNLHVQHIWEKIKYIVGMSNKK
jgi:hypothetical protein